MAKLESTLEFTETVSPAFIGQIMAPKKTDWFRKFQPWFRRGGFFAAFIVMPGILGGLHLTSDRFNVGLMVGGFLAMILDDYLQKPRFPRRPKAGVGRFDRFPRKVGPDGLTVIMPGTTSTHNWARISAVEKFPLGLALFMGHGLVFPIEYTQLPPSISPDGIFELVTAWRDAAAKKISA